MFSVKIQGCWQIYQKIESNQPKDLGLKSKKKKVHKIRDKHSHCKSFPTDVDIHVCSVSACVDLKAVFGDT